jgi:hypothetical protein
MEISRELKTNPSIVVGGLAMNVCKNFSELG